MRYFSYFKHNLSFTFSGNENPALCNIIALTLVISALPFMAVFYLSQLYTLVFATILSILLILTSLILNKFHRYFLAELNIMLQMGLIAFPFFTLFLDYHSGVYFIYIPVAILPHLLMHHRSPAIKWGISITISISSIASLIVFTFFIPPPFYLQYRLFI